MMKDTPLEKDVELQLENLIQQNIIDALAEDINYNNAEEFNNKCLDHIILRLIKIRKSGQYRWRGWPI